MASARPTRTRSTVSASACIDLFNADHLHDKVEASLHQKNQMLVKLYNRRPIDVDQTTEELLKLGERLKPYVANTA